MNLDQARSDYRNDPMFRRVVDTMQQWIFEMNITPAEARAAAMLASVMVEERRPSPMQVYPPLKQTPSGHWVIDTDGWPAPYPGGMGKG